MTAYETRKSSPVSAIFRRFTVAVRYAAILTQK